MKEWGKKSSTGFQPVTQTGQSSFPEPELCPARQDACSTLLSAIPSVCKLQLPPGLECLQS